MRGHDQMLGMLIILVCATQGRALEQSGYDWKYLAFEAEKRGWITIERPQRGAGKPRGVGYIWMLGEDNNFALRPTTKGKSVYKELTPLFKKIYKLEKK